MPRSYSYSRAGNFVKSLLLTVWARESGRRFPGFAFRYCLEECSLVIVRSQYTFIMRPMKNVPFCTNSASDSNFNPRNTLCIHQGTYFVAPVVKIFVFLDLAQNGAFFKDLIMKRVHCICSKESGWKP